MASSREVQSVLRRFNADIDEANRIMKQILEAVRELEDVLEHYDADKDLDVNRGLKKEIERGKDQITELRKTVDKLDNELSDTNRKFSNLAR